MWNRDPALACFVIKANCRIQGCCIRACRQRLRMFRYLPTQSALTSPPIKVSSAFCNSTQEDPKHINKRIRAGWDNHGPPAAAEALRSSWTSCFRCLDIHWCKDLIFLAFRLERPRQGCGTLSSHFGGILGVGI